MQGLYCGSKLAVWFKSGRSTRTSIMQCNGRKYTLLNKQNHICSSILVVNSVLCIHYNISKDGFTLRRLLGLQTFKVFQALYSIPILNPCIWFLVSWKIFWTFLINWSCQNQIRHPWLLRLQLRCHYIKILFSISMISSKLKMKSNLIICPYFFIWHSTVSPISTLKPHKQVYGECLMKYPLPVTSSETLTERIQIRHNWITCIAKRLLT